MQTISKLRHQTIESLTLQPSEMAVDALVALWERVASQIVLLVGEGGFDSLYMRSLFLSQSEYPWLSASALVEQTDHRFSKLKASLQTQPLALAKEANNLLLVTFTDILASLIGESLTASILNSAWGGVDAPYSTSKEPNNAP